jgi:hypothetical protein
MSAPGIWGDIFPKNKTRVEALRDGYWKALQRCASPTELQKIYAGEMATSEEREELRQKDPLLYNILQRFWVPKA